MLCIRSTKLLTVLPGFRATSSPLDTVVSLPDLRFIPPSTTAYGGWQADNQQDATRLGFFPGFRLPPPLHSTLDDSPILALLLTSATLPFTQLDEPVSSTHRRTHASSHRPTTDPHLSPHLNVPQRHLTVIAHADVTTRLPSTHRMLCNCIRSTQPLTALLGSARHCAFGSACSAICVTVTLR
jgi:hypothetical protein